jgi:uncharacterized surface protein with fasciclin (FAS1) repeats
MNDLKLRNTVVAAIGVALTVASFGAVQAQSKPADIKSPVQLKKTPTVNAPGASPTTPSKPKPAAQSSPASSPTTSPGSTTPGSTATPNIVELAASSSQFTKLVAAVKSADLAEALSAEGPYTLFAPNDKAFAKVPKATLDKLLKPANKAELQKVLKYHVIAGAVMAADVKSGSVGTAEGSSLKLVAAQGAVTVNGAKVIKADNKASNGVVHVIDTVLIPPTLKLK